MSQMRSKQKPRSRMETFVLVFLGMLIFFFYILSKLTPEKAETRVDYYYLDGNYSLYLPSGAFIDREDFPDPDYSSADDAASSLNPLNTDTTNSYYTDSNVKPTDSYSTNSYHIPYLKLKEDIEFIHSHYSYLTNPDYLEDILKSASTNSPYSDDGASNSKPTDIDSTTYYPEDTFSIDTSPTSNSYDSSTINTESKLDENSSTWFIQERYGDTFVQINFTSFVFYHTKDYSLACQNLDECGVLKLVPEVEWEPLNLLGVIVNNSLIDVIEDEVFERCVKLSVLHLKFSKIGRIERDDFVGLNKLVDLNLTHNEITFIETGAFDSLASLKSLDLSYNRIQEINNLTFLGLDNLVLLDLTRNQLSTINEYVFVDAKIQYLNLSFNYLKFFNASIYKGIENVDLSHNRITSSDFNTKKFNSKFLDALNSQSKLLILDLSHNLITDVQVGPSLDSLRAINLGDNRIKSFTLDNPNVRELMLRNNLVEYFNSLDLAGLRRCNLTNNKVPCVQLEEALFSLDCILNSPEGVKAITCVEDGKDMLRDSNVLLLLNFLLGLGLLCIFLYYIKIIGYTWIIIRKDI